MCPIAQQAGPDEATLETEALAHPTEVPAAGYFDEVEALRKSHFISKVRDVKMKILMVLTSHDRLGDTGKKTGFWLEEFAAPFYVFRDAGAEIVLASPKGGQPPLDPGTVSYTHLDVYKRQTRHCVQEQTKLPTRVDIWDEGLRVLGSSRRHGNSIQLSPAPPVREEVPQHPVFS